MDTVPPRPRWPESFWVAASSAHTVPASECSPELRVVLGALERANQYVADILVNRIAASTAAPLLRSRPAGSHRRPRVGITQVLLMPVGDRCNLACTYCYEATRRRGGPTMDVARLEAILQNVLPFVDGRLEVTIHGGEPLLAGRRFFQTLIDLLRAEANGPFHVSMQTNGTLLDAAWAQWLSRNSVGVGISLDGTPEDHDALRIHRDGSGSWAEVVRGMGHLRSASVPFGVIAVFGPAQARREGSARAMFEALVAEDVRAFNVQPAYSPTSPPSMNVGPEAFADFLIALFEAWLAHGDPSVRIALFDHLFQSMTGHAPEVCYFSGRCTSIVGVGPDGTVIPCTRPFASQYSFGNLADTPLPQLLEGQAFRGFAAAELAGRQPGGSCRWERMCMGGCPHERLDAHGQAVDGSHVYCTCTGSETGGYPALFSYVTERTAGVVMGSA